MQAFLVGSWLMVALWLVVSACLVAYNWPWACLMLLCTIAFAFYLSRVAERLESLRTKVFDLVLDEEYVKLTVYDLAGGPPVKKKLFWSEIRWAEIYRYGDAPSILLRGRESSFEIPLWAFGFRKRAIIKRIKDEQLPLLRLP